MLPIIHEDLVISNVITHNVSAIFKDNEIFTKTVKHFVKSYIKLLSDSKDKKAFIKYNTEFVIGSIDKCLYKYTQKHVDCKLYFRLIKRIEVVVNSKDIKPISKIMKIKRLLKV